jgi:hypothetical protein
MHLERPNWSREAQLASSVWFAHDNSTRWLIIERHGLQKAVEIETFFLKKHQDTHFIDGATKLGIIDHPHHVLCAEYHCLSNLLGGLDMGFRGDAGDGRAWVFYFTPQASAGGPLLPGPAATALPFEMMKPFFSWHARNGDLLGNARLYFTLTDHVMAGGPYDAGYFAEADRPLKPEQRLRIELGATDVVPGPPPNLAYATWPQARRDAALRKYCGEYCLGGLAQVALTFGMEETAAIAELSHTANIVAWARPLAIELEMTGDPPAARLADLFKKVWGLLDDRFESHLENGEVLLEHTRTRLSAPQFSGWETPPRAIEDAFARAWTVASRAIGPPVDVSVVESRSEGVDNTVWRFKGGAFRTKAVAEAAASISK